MAKKKKFPIILIALGVAMLIMANLDAGDQETLPTGPSDIYVGWMDTYQQDLGNEGIDVEYLATTSYYDTDSDYIQSVSANILSKANSPKEAVEDALQYVYARVEYVPGESDAACLNGIGSKIIQSGTGQCDTQSISVITLLRSMGIASRPVGGCAHYDAAECAPMQAIFKFKKEPKLAEIRVIDGLAVGRGGYLHAWVEVWLPNKGWVTLESTTGEFAAGNCYAYVVELRPSNEDKYHICFAESRDFAIQCQRL